MTTMIEKEITPLVIAKDLDDHDFFICGRTKDMIANDWNLFTITWDGGRTVVSRDLDYIAIGAKRYKSQSGAVRAAKKIIAGRESEYLNEKV